MVKTIKNRIAALLGVVSTLGFAMNGASGVVSALELVKSENFPGEQAKANEIFNTYWNGNNGNSRGCTPEEYAAVINLMKNEEKGKHIEMIYFYPVEEGKRYGIVFKSKGKSWEVCCDQNDGKVIVFNNDQTGAIMKCIDQEKKGNPQPENVKEKVVEEPQPGNVKEKVVEERQPENVKEKVVEEPQPGNVKEKVVEERQPENVKEKVVEEPKSTGSKKVALAVTASAASLIAILAAIEALSTANNDVTSLEEDF